jgi:hypothetical protein
MITQYEGNGFRMDFVNGYTISVLWSQRSVRIATDNEMGYPSATTVEVGIFPTADGTRDFVRPDCNFEPEETSYPISYVNTELLAKLIAWTQGLRSVTQ